MTEKKKIIVVDDVNLHLLSTKSRLQKKYHVFTAQSADLLFELLENVIPDLILLDVNMPMVNGYEIITELKANNTYSNIPVIFLTAKGDESSVMKGMEHGANDYVVKPFTDKALIDRIEFQLDPVKREVEKSSILAIDDAPSTLKSINFALKDKYKEYALSNPEHITDLLKKVTPDLFILDYKMPGLSGFDLIPMIRKIPRYVKTPIIILTTEGTATTMAEAIKLGACDFIVKPIDDELLHKKVAMHITTHMVKRHQK